MDSKSCGNNFSETRELLVFLTELVDEFPLYAEMNVLSNNKFRSLEESKENQSPQINVLTT